MINYSLKKERENKKNFDVQIYSLLKYNYDDKGHIKSTKTLARLYSKNDNPLYKIDLINFDEYGKDINSDMFDIILEEFYNDLIYNQDYKNAINTIHILKLIQNILDRRFKDITINDIDIFLDNINCLPKINIKPIKSTIAEKIISKDTPLLNLRYQIINGHDVVANADDIIFNNTFWNLDDSIDKHLPYFEKFYAVQKNKAIKNMHNSNNLKEAFDLIKENIFMCHMYNYIDDKALDTLITSCNSLEKILESINDESCTKIYEHQIFNEIINKIGPSFIKIIPDSKIDTLFKTYIKLYHHDLLKYLPDLTDDNLENIPNNSIDIKWLRNNNDIFNSHYESLEYNELIKNIDNLIYKVNSEDEEKTTYVLKIIMSFKNQVINEFNRYALEQTMQDNPSNTLSKAKRI